MADRNVDRIRGGYMRSKAKQAALRRISEARVDSLDVLEEDVPEEDLFWDYCFVDDEPTYPDDCFDDYAGYPSYPFRKPEVLIEDTWRDDDAFDSSDGGVGYLRYVMEGVKPSEIHFKDIGWLVKKYALLSAIVLGGLLSEEFFDNKEQSLILGRYSIALEGELMKKGIKFVTFRGLTEEGWETYSRLIVPTASM